MANVQHILCPRCHKPNNPRAKFCQSCGHDMVLNNPGPRYYITRVIKAGGQGAVYQTVGDDGKVYAVKEMLDPFTDAQERADAIARFEHEAHMLRQLQHPRIPRVYINFKDEGRHYLAMDFIQGEDLEEVVLRHGAQPEQLVLEWAEQICDVMGYLHDNGLIYRDIKPSNAMIDKQNGGIKVIDFGIAKLLQHTGKGTQIGTPGYAPPEQYQGLATQVSDIYALGATLHHLLTGRDPQDESPFSFPPANSVQPSISQRTSDALDKALQMRPQDRFQSIAEFCSALGVTYRGRPAAQPRGAQQPRPAPQPQPQPRPAPPPQPRPAPRAAPPQQVPAPPPQPPQPAQRQAAARQQPPPQPQQATTPPAQPPKRSSTQQMIQNLRQGAKPGQAGGQASGSAGLRIVGIFLALACSLVAAYFAYNMMGAQPAQPTATPQTLIQQSFTANDMQVIVSPDIDKAGLRSAFISAYSFAAREQFGQGVRVQENTLSYVGGEPVKVSEDERGDQYRASMEGLILVPTP